MLELEIPISLKNYQLVKGVEVAIVSVSAADAFRGFKGVRINVSNEMEMEMDLIFFQKSWCLI
jgi:hypothetical protein